MKPRRLAAFSVDLDEIGEYFSIHGLGAGAPSENFSEENSRVVDGPGQFDAVYRVALPRLLSFAEELELPLCLFVIGKDLRKPGNAERLAPFVSRGDELGNHSLDHLYHLSRLPAAEQIYQVSEGARLIEEQTGARVRGFRAPGYTISSGLLNELRGLGYMYDSSVFPCPAYYFAKASVLFGQRLLGRSSASILDTPKVLLAPTTPYRTGASFYSKGAGLRELPISVSRGPRLPFIGTSVSLMSRGGPLAVRALTASMKGLPYVNFELHGIDFLDSADGLQALSPYQPDLNISVGQKIGAFRQVVTELREAGYEWVRLDELALAALP